jgi:hypothetical protein
MGASERPSSASEEWDWMQELFSQNHSKDFNLEHHTNNTPDQPHNLFTDFLSTASAPCILIYFYLNPKNAITIYFEF